MAADGIISAEECSQAALPLYSRSWEEWLKPFVPTPGPLRAKFFMAHASQYQVMAPAWTRFQQTKDATQLGQDYAGSMEACSKHSLQKCLDARTVDQQQSVMRELYRRFGNAIVQAPCKSLGDFILLDLVKMTETHEYVSRFCCSSIESQMNFAWSSRGLTAEGACVQSVQHMYPARAWWGLKCKAVRAISSRIRLIRSLTFSAALRCKMRLFPDMHLHR